MSPVTDLPAALITKSLMQVAVDLYPRFPDKLELRAELKRVISAEQILIDKALDYVVNLFISDGVIHKRSLRYIEKRLLRDLWRAWREASFRVKPNNELPPAEQSQDERLAA